MSASIGRSSQPLPTGKKLAARFAAHWKHRRAQRWTPGSKCGAASVTCPPRGKKSAGPRPVSAFIEPESVRHSDPAREPPGPFRSQPSPTAVSRSRAASVQRAETRTARSDGITGCFAILVVQAVWLVDTTKQCEKKESEPLNARWMWGGNWTSSCLLVLAAALISTGPVWADSELMLPVPVIYGTIPAATFDAGRQRVGDANLKIEKLEDGTVRIFAESGFDDGARTVATATLAPIVDTNLLRPVWQQSRSIDANHNELGVMNIDHRAGEATCSFPRSEGEGMRTQRIPLPKHDRVANVPLHLLFDPLIKGDAATVDFQILLCGSHAKLMDFQARVVRRDDDADGSERLVEVRYGPDFGTFFSLLAKAVVPRLSFWFDPASPSPWIAHRMPLYADGPEVFVVRQGIETNTLLD